MSPRPENHGGIPKSKQSGRRARRTASDQRPEERNVIFGLFNGPLDRTSPEPLHAQLASHIRRAILEGRLLPGERLPAESDVCTALSVSRNTVIRAMNDLRGEGLLYRERGSGTYVRSLMERPAVRQDTLRLGVVSPALSLPANDPYLSGVLSGISAALQDVNAVAVLGSRAANPSSDYFQEITRRDIDGFLVIAPRKEHRNTLSVLARNGIPFVLVGAALEEDWDAVLADNQTGTRTAVEHLHALGHQRIALFTGPRSAFDSEARWTGFRKACSDFMIEVPTAWDVELANESEWEADIRRTLGRWMRSNNPPTALLAAGFPLLLASVRTLKALSVEIPARLSLVGFDDYAVAEYIEPALTTVRQPLEAMGASAVRLLAGRIRGEIGGQAVRQVLPVDFVVRKSTAGPPRP